MKDKFYSYLCNQPGGSDAVHLVRDVMNLKGASAQVAEKIVYNSISGDTRFIRDEQGKWHAKSGSAIELHKVKFILVEVKEQPQAVKTAQNLHFEIIENLRSISRGILRVRWDSSPLKIDLDWSDVHESRDTQCKNTQTFFRDVDGACIVEFKGSRAFRILNKLNLAYFGDDLECDVISLKKFGSFLLNEKITSLSILASKLGIAYVEREDSAGIGEVMSNCFIALLERSRERNIASLDELLKTQESQEPAIDFLRYNFDAKFIKNLPEAPGVYLMKSRIGEVLYVGKARNLRKRVGNYFRATEESPQKIALLRDHLFEIETQLVGSELEALLLEHELITTLNPPVNTQLQVHERTVPVKDKGQRIVILPSVEEDKLELFFVSELARFARASVDAVSVRDKKIYDQIVTLFFNPSVDNIPDSEKEKSEIVFSWLSRHKDLVNWIDVSKTADSHDCHRLLMEHVRGFDKKTRAIYL